MLQDTTVLKEPHYQHNSNAPQEHTHLQLTTMISANASLALQECIALKLQFSLLVIVNKDIIALRAVSSQIRTPALMEPTWITEELKLWLNADHAY